MIKKINCKHGLTKDEELAARKLRNKLEKFNLDAIEELSKLYVEWDKGGGLSSFFSFLKSKNVVFYSALLRLPNPEMYVVTAIIRA